MYIYKDIYICLYIYIHTYVFTWNFSDTITSSKDINRRRRLQLDWLTALNLLFLNKNFH